MAMQEFTQALGPAKIKAIVQLDGLYRFTWLYKAGVYTTHLLSAIPDSSMRLRL